MRWLFPLIPLLACCNLGGGVALGDGSPDADDTGEVDAREPDGDGEDDGDLEGLVGEGPLTFVVERIEVLTERLCDLDGDGHADNAIANLGPPSAAILASAVTSALQMVVEGDNKWLLHSPLVQDRSTPDDASLTLIAFRGEEVDLCLQGAPGRDPSDDFSGEQVFCVDLEALDDCAEPVSVSHDASIEEGAIVASFDPVDFFVPLRRAIVEGRIAPGSRRAETSLCGYISPGDVGDHHGFYGVADVTTLEVFLSGGRAMGIPTVPGIDPDIDLDGDGLERIRLDTEYHVAECVDGDGTVIVGSDCWRDERIVDGFSLALRTRLVSAVFEGNIEPGYEERECGAVLESIAGFGGTHRERQKIDDVCPGQRELMKTLLACGQERCPDADRTSGSDECRVCAQSQCPNELADCLDAPDCCPDPPETSAWDPA